MKKIISLALVFAILLTCVALPTTVFAATNLAAFSYSGGVASTVLSSDYGNKNGYAFTSNIGLNAIVYGSANTTSKREFSWTDVAYENGNGINSATVPCIEAGSSNLWQRGCYFQIELPTTGYKDIIFSAKLGGSGKAPRDFVLQYSLNGSTYANVGSTVTAAKESMKQAFNRVQLPSAANDQSKLYIRIFNNSLYMINGTTGFVGTSKGRLAINDIVIEGTNMSDKLHTPVADVADGEMICSDELITLTSPDSADIKFTVNNGTEQTYSAPFSPFDYVAYGTQTATVAFYATEEGKTDSDTAEVTYTWNGDSIARFNYDAQPSSLAGEINATSGSYPRSKVSASANGNDMFVPLFNNEKGNSISIAPDDGVKFGENGYWLFETSTAGYTNVKFSADACSSKKGPGSFTLSYSLNGTDYTVLETNKPVPTGSVSAYYLGYALPEAAWNKDKVYIKLAMTENKRADASDSLPLFNNESKGNTFINNIIVSGVKNGDPLKPYADKSSLRFSENGLIDYISPSGDEMVYNIYDGQGNKIVDEEIYSAPISLGTLPDFDSSEINKYTVEIYSVNGNKTSIADINEYSYKGQIITAFEYDSVTAGSTSLNATTGSGSIQIFPNARNAATLEYNKKSIYARADEDNYWMFSKNGTVSSDGYWLIQTSTAGYKNIIFSAKQVSSLKGPRDYSIMYSTNGVSYYPVKDSFVRVSDSTEKSYTNFKLPDALNNCQTVYLKIKISGGENVEGNELDGTQDDGTIDSTVLGSGNTGINNIEICGVPVSASEEILTMNSLKVDYNTQYTVNANVSGDFKVLITYYDADGVMIGVRLSDSTETTFTVNDSNVASVKAFLVDGLNNIKPLTSNIVRDF